MSELFTCSHCEYEYSIDVRNEFDGQELCDDCYEEQTVTCDDCGRRIWETDAEGSNCTLCTRCFENNYTSCESCGATVHNENACYFDDDGDYPYCSACYERQSSNDYIHDYGYKPTPIFYGEGDRYFGVELEIDIGGHDDVHAETLTDLVNHSDRLIYIKHDGSLDDGMEIVTHPMSLHYHINEMPWLDLVNKSIELGYRSHKTSTCGLHVHVNRTAFGDTQDEQETCISRVLFFVERFWQELLKFSRRTEIQMSRWAARYGIKENPKATLDNAKKAYSGRYTCINLTNYNTIEFRIFRGTLKYSTIIATLQLVNKICDFATFMTDEEMTNLNWCDFVAGVTEPELVTYLKARRLYVNDPIECEEDV